MQTYVSTVTIQMARPMKMVLIMMIHKICGITSAPRSILWRGGLAIWKSMTKGEHEFSFGNTGHARLRVQWLGSGCPINNAAEAQQHDVRGVTHVMSKLNTECEYELFHSGASSTSTSDGHWIYLVPGKYQLTLTFLHLTGAPTISLKYWAGGIRTLLSKSAISAVMPGSRCDTMSCATGLTPKPNATRLYCKGVSCTLQDDYSANTQTCCARQYLVVSAGDHRTCALDVQGHPVCWGSWSGHNEEWKNHPGPFKDISTRDKYTCAVHSTDVAKKKDKVECWIEGAAGTPGTSDTSSIDFTEGTFDKITVGGHHICGMWSSGYVACEKDDDHNIVASDWSGYSGNMFDMVSSGTEYSCGIKTSPRTVTCWGNNDHGQTAVPTNDGTPIQDYTHLDAGADHACGITNGAIRCWGGNTDNQATPPAGTDYAKVAAGGKHSCALKADGQVKCWGDDQFGQSTPRSEDAPYTAISAGAMHTCAIKSSDKEIVCWGSNHEEQADQSLTWSGQSEPPPAEA